VATLAYLALQIRRNTESMRMGAELELSKQQADFHAHVNARPELSRIYDAAAEDPLAMTPDERRQFLWLVAECFVMYEGHYLIYRKGYISADTWEPKAAALHGFLQNPLVQEWWEQRTSPIGDEFYRYIEEHRSQLNDRWTHKSIGGIEPDRRGKAAQ
jgi:hypothetical protein